MNNGLGDGVYMIAFTNEQYLTAPDRMPGVPLMLLPTDHEAGEQRWQVERTADGTHTIRIAGSNLFVSFDGEPDMHELVLLQERPRDWQILPTAEPDTHSVAVPNSDFRLGMSLLRIYPPRVALAPNYGDPYQAWFFKRIG